MDRLQDPGGPLPETDVQTYKELVGRLRKYWVQADARREVTRREPAAAEKSARSPYGRPTRLLAATTTGAEVVR